MIGILFYAEWFKYTEAAICQKRKIEKKKKKKKEAARFILWLGVCKTAPSTNFRLFY